MNETSPFICGSRLILKPFKIEDITEKYLFWLSDPEVNRYSQRLNASPISESEARSYLTKLKEDECIFSINLDDEHVGNIKYGPIDWINDRVDISIVIGERKAWGKSIGAEAIYLLSRYLFREVGVNRLDAGTCNPNFIKTVKKIGWKIEGIQKQRIRIGTTLMDYTILAQLAHEFKDLSQYNK